MTQRVALIGNPLKRRHSVVMQNAAFAAHGIDARYELSPIESEDVLGFFEVARGAEWLGFGVTAPYKQVALTHAAPSGVLGKGRWLPPWLDRAQRACPTAAMRISSAARM